MLFAILEEILELSMQEAHCELLIFLITTGHEGLDVPGDAVSDLKTLWKGLEPNGLRFGDLSCSCHVMLS